MLPEDTSGKLLYSDVDYVDTWAAMEECVHLGLTKSTGVSNFNKKQLERVLQVAKVPLVNNQVSVVAKVLSVRSTLWLKYYLSS